MSRGNGSSVIPVAVFLAILIIILPVSAYNVAIYGTNAGFDPSLHSDSVVVVREIPGSSGADLDNNIDQFVQPSGHRHQPVVRNGGKIACCQPAARHLATRRLGDGATVDDA